MPEFEPDWRLPQGEVLIEAEVPSSLSYKEGIVLRVQRALLHRGCLNLDDQPDAELFLDEGIKNAMIHGNGEVPARKVKVTVVDCGDHWVAVIEDEGQGVKPEDVPAPLEAEGEHRESGFGILMMESKVRELIYAGRGNCLVLVCDRSADDGGLGRDTLASIVMPSRELLARSEYVAAADPTRTPLEFDVDPSAGPHAAQPSASTENLTITEDRGALVLQVLTARVSDDNFDQLASEMLGVFRANTPVIVDLTRVRYVSSNALALFLRLLKAAEGLKSKLLFCGLSAELQQTFACTRLDMILSIFDHSDTAFAALGR